MPLRRVVITAVMLVLGVEMTSVLPGFGAPSGRVTFQSASAGPPVTIVGYVDHPSGHDPFPALVLLHGCNGRLSGIFPYATWLNQLGYVTLVVDSWSPRHVDGLAVCKRGGGRRGEQTADAFGALNYLRSLPFIDGTRIGVMGWDHGGGVAAYVSINAVSDLWEPVGKGFRTAIAFYPNCRVLLSSAADGWLPLLVLIGTVDDWSDPGVCKVAYAEALQNGQAMTLKLFTGATHAFDGVLVVGRTVVYLGHRIRYNSADVQAARVAVQQFLHKYLH